MNGLTRNTQKPNFMIEQIISGGQTGVDTIALEEAKLAGIPTGGKASHGWRTELGSRPELKDLYGLKESKGDYKTRTKENVLESDATVLFGNLSSFGTALTIRYCIAYKKPFITNPTSEQLLQFISENDVKKLNVAGNRASKLSKQGIEVIRETLRETFSKLK